MAAVLTNRFDQNLPLEVDDTSKTQAIWANRFDLNLPLEVDDTSNTQVYVQEIQKGADMDHENALYQLIHDGDTHWAPISKDKAPKRILHLGCGNGNWVAQMAATYHGAEVFGVEICELGPKERSELHNCHFVAHDPEAKDAWGKDTYDFIYCRYAYLRVKDWKEFLSNIFAHLAPGGWIELVESDPHIGCDDGSLTPSCVTQKLYNAVQAIVGAGGKDANRDIGPNLVRNLEKIGFTNVQTKAAKTPHGPWAKDPQYKKLGSHSLALVSLPVWAQQLQYGVGLPADEAKKMAADAMEELVGGKVHAYNIVRWVIAQKP